MDVGLSPCAVLLNLLFTPGMTSKGSSGRLARPDLLLQVAFRAARLGSDVFARCLPCQLTISLVVTLALVEGYSAPVLLCALSVDGFSQARPVVDSGFYFQDGPAAPV